MLRGGVFWNFAFREGKSLDMTRESIETNSDEMNPVINFLTLQNMNQSHHKNTRSAGKCSSADRVRDRLTPAENLPGKGRDSGRRSSAAERT